jgi:hypothetical protein
MEPCKIVSLNLTCLRIALYESSCNSGTHARRMCVRLNSTKACYKAASVVVKSVLFVVVVSSLLSVER